MDSWWRRKKAIIVQIVVWWDRLYEQFGNACTVPLAFQVNFFSGGAGSKIPWRRGMLHTPVFLGFPMAQLVKNLPAVWETWVRSLGCKDFLEKEMATHSSIFAWKIPWIEEPGRLQSTGSQRVGQEWALTYTVILHWDTKQAWLRSHSTENLLCLGPILSSQGFFFLMSRSFSRESRYVSAKHPSSWL